MAPPPLPMSGPGKLTSNHHHYDSDSGLGTSISNSQLNLPFNQNESNGMGTLGVPQFNFCNQPRMPSDAWVEIQRTVLDPILAEDKFKAFHDLVLSIPAFVNTSQIRSLRDLEKTFVWLAPQVTASYDSFVQFFEFTVQCLRTTYPRLNERYRCLPTDRPYTNGYLLDLVDQMRQLAATIAASKEKPATDPRPQQPTQYGGEHANASIHDRVTLEGGLAQNGRPAELVVHKDGQVISLQTGKPFDGKPNDGFFGNGGNVGNGGNAGPSAQKQPAKRSMARRKKGEPPMKLNIPCPDCDETFDRPCDLTKHSKRHLRAWKCPEFDCEYNTIGFPNKPDMLRHWNELHSESPIWYYCPYTPCPYKSKRRDNVKQHMMGGHDWVYIPTRGKNKNKLMTKANSKRKSTKETPTTRNSTSRIRKNRKQPAPKVRSPTTQGGGSANQTQPTPNIGDPIAQEGAFTNQTPPTPNIGDPIAQGGAFTNQTLQTFNIGDPIAQAAAFANQTPQTSNIGDPIAQEGAFTNQTPQTFNIEDPIAQVAAFVYQTPLTSSIGDSMPQGAEFTNQTPLTSSIGDPMLQGAGFTSQTPLTSSIGDSMLQGAGFTNWDFNLADYMPSPAPQGTQIGNYMAAPMPQEAQLANQGLGFTTYMPTPAPQPAELSMVDYGYMLASVPQEANQMTTLAPEAPTYMPTAEAEDWQLEYYLKLN